jgi:hypothetical protein
MVRGFTGRWITEEWQFSLFAFCDGRSGFSGESRKLRKQRLELLWEEGGGLPSAATVTCSNRQSQTANRLARRN